MFKQLFQKKNNENQYDLLLGHKVLGADHISDSAVFLPFEDRFAHTLIVGPAGSQKTSQTIIPTIWSDMQIKNKPLGITVLTPDGLLAEKTCAMAIYHNNQIDEAIARGDYNKNKHGEKKIIQYFDPMLKNCPYFNPLEGDEDDVIENIATVFSFMNPDMPQFVRDLEDIVIRKAVKAVKRLLGNEATLLDLKTVLCNPEEGKTDYILPLATMQTLPNGNSVNPVMQHENSEIAEWFLKEYYVGATEEDGVSKTYQNAQNLRKSITNLVENTRLNRIFNIPRKSSPNYEEYLKFQQTCSEKNLFYKIDFEEALQKGHVVAINTNCYKMRDLCAWSFLNYFFMLQLQTAICKRYAAPQPHIPNMIYIRNFDCYSNFNFVDVLKMSKNYNVAFHISVYSLSRLGANIGVHSQDFINIVTTHIQNHIVYPGVLFGDAVWYSILITQYTSINRTPRQLRQKDIDFYKNPFAIINRPHDIFTYRTKSEHKWNACGVKAMKLSKELEELLENIVENEIRDRFEK